MSNRKSVLNMLTKAGVVFKRIGRSIRIRACAGPKNEGWDGHESVLSFDARGQLVSVAATVCERRKRAS